MANDDVITERPTILSPASILRSSVKTIDGGLNGYSVATKDVSALAEALKFNLSLRSIYLNAFWLQRNHVLAIAQALKENINLEYVNVSRITLGLKNKWGKADCIRAFIDVLTSNKTITDFNLSFRESTFDFPEHYYGKLFADDALFKALKSNPLLKAFAITDCFASANSANQLIAPLARALTFNTTLTSINVRRNHIGDFGVNKLAQALQGNSTLRSLNLAFNDISHGGAKSIATALQSQGPI